MKELLRWIITAGAVVAVFFAVLYFNLFVLMFGPFPKDLAEPTAGFLIGFFTVLTGSLLAPRHRIVVALILLVAGAALITTLLRFLLAGTLGGGIMAIGFIAWWFHVRHTKRSTLWLGICSCTALLIFIVLVYARFVDRPARPDELPQELVNVLDKNTSLVSAFYSYDYGGFIDHEWLWRIDATPEAMTIIISGLGLQSNNLIPSDFWRMPPYYWPRFMPDGGEAFQSSMFSGDSRGPDGSHYFMVYDKAHSQAFVWVKNNF